MNEQHQKGKVNNMKCMEVFYRKSQAEKFFEGLQDEDWETNAEMIESIDEDINEKCWIVYFNPKPLRR